MKKRLLSLMCIAWLMFSQVTATMQGQIVVYAKDSLDNNKTAINENTPENIPSNVAVLDSVDVELLDDEISLSDVGKRNHYSTFYYDLYGSLHTQHMIENPDGSYAFITDQHMVENPDGDYELLKEPQVTVLEQNGKVRSKKGIPQELPMFGGFYEGADYFYLAFGQKNPDDDTELEVLRIVKYTKDWNRVGSCSIYGAKSREIFRGGSLSMAECNGYLTVHTCRVMYGPGDEAGHQSSMYFLIRTSDMELVRDESAFPHMNWVSHSFNQFSLADSNENRFYYVDHGDAYPRSINLFSTKYDANNNFKPYDTVKAMPMTIKGEIGDNYTGVTLSGFELSDENCIILGNSIDQNEDTTSKIRNVFITVTDRKTMSESKIIWLTHYTEKDLFDPDDYEQPLIDQKLIKLNENNFVVLWTEYQDQNVDANAPEGTEEYCRSHPNSVLDYDISINYTTKMLLIDGKGNATSDVQIFPGVQLSDYQPIVNSKGNIVFPSIRQKLRYTYYYDEWKKGKRTWWEWNRDEEYVDTRLLYQIDLTSFELAPICGDITSDGVITIADAVLLCRYVNEDSTMNNSTAKKITQQNADLDNDGEITALDVTTLLYKLAHT